MPAEIEEAYKQSFRSGMQIKFQQNQPRLKKICRVESLVGEKTSFDRISPVEAEDISIRNAETTYSETAIDRRWISTSKAFKAQLVDKRDKLSVIGDPSGQYVTNFTYALNRRTDRKIATAILGTAYTGETGTTAQTLTGSAAGQGTYQHVGPTYVESGAAATSNLTIGKLRRALEILQNAEVLGPMVDMPKYFVCGPSQIHALLRSTEVTSQDYNSVKALVDGRVNSFLGFEFIVIADNPVSTDYNVLPKGTIDSQTNCRTCFACVQGGAVYGVQEELFTDLTVIPTRHYSTQAYASRQDGAVRFWEEAVVAVYCDEDV